MSSLMSTYPEPSLCLVRGSGATVWDHEGCSYLDLVGGIAVNVLGHCHPRVVEAVQRQVSELVHVSNLYGSLPQRELAGRLAALSGGMRSFFCNSGAEAVEAALKLARAWATERGKPGRDVVAFDGGFHGRTFGALSATGQPAKKTRFEPLAPGFRHVPFPDTDAFERALDEDVIALIVEPIQGEGGVVVPPPDFLPHLRSVCSERDVLLIADEVQTGVGRTGRMFAVDHQGVQPDIMCLAKGLGGGLPIGACLATPEVAASFKPGDHASTFGGGPVQCAAALAVLDVIDDDDLLERASVLGDRTMKELAEVFEGAHVRGQGFLIGVELPEDSAAEVVTAAQTRGVLVNAAAPAVVRLAPPLTIEESDLGRALSVLREVWVDLR